MKWILLLGLLSALAAVTAAFLWFRPWYPTTAHENRETVADVASETWAQGVGYVEPCSDVHCLAFKSNGVIGKCQVELGEPVPRGKVLMTLQNEDEIKAAAVAEQEVAVARAERDKVASGVNHYQVAA